MLVNFGPRLGPLDPRTVAAFNYVLELNERGTPFIQRVVKFKFEADMPNSFVFLKLTHTPKSNRNFFLTVTHPTNSEVDFSLKGSTLPKGLA